LSLLLLIWAWVAPAAAQSDFDPRGLPIAGVTLAAPRGGLPEESLEALLRARQGDPWSPQTIRSDLTTLFRIGDFSAVEADASPWFIYDANGVQQPAVQLTYRVLPAPRAARVRIQGNRSFSNRKVLEAAGITPGEVFYPELDGPEVAERLQAWLRRQGWVEAEVEVDAVPSRDDRDQLEIWLRIAEGQPNVLTELTFLGDLPNGIEEADLVRWARRAGVKVGKPISSEQITTAQLEMRSRLARVTRGLFQPRRGWINARLAPAVTRGEGGAVSLTWAVEAGPRLELAVDGLRWRPEKKVRDALGIDERLRLTRGFVDEAPLRLERYLRRNGFYAATAEVELRGGNEEVQTLYVRIERGARHSLRGQPPRRSLEFEGNEHLNQAALVRVLDQASEDVIRLDYFTEDELEDGFAAIRNLYRSRGYQSAELELVDVRIEPLGNALTRPFVALGAGLLGNPRPKRITPTIQVTEGPITTQRLAAIGGAASEVVVSDLDDELDRLSGEPFDPLTIDRISRQVVERHRAAGYLEVDVRVAHDDVPGSDGTEIDSVVQVTPGPLVLLRSVVTRGARFTAPALIRRDAALERGVPLSSEALERARRRLYELGIFGSIGTELLGDGEARDLLITVRERPRWAAEAGFGLNTDQGLRTIGRLTRRNLFGVAHRIDAYALVGLDYASDSLSNRIDSDNIEWRAAISYTAPHFPLPQQDLVMDVLLQERRQEPTWRMARTGVGFTVDTALGPNTRLQTALRAERRQLQEVDSRALLEGEPWTGLVNDVDAAAEKACFPCRAADSILAVLLHDMRDDPVQPSQGLLLSWIAEAAPGLPWQAPELRSRFLKSELRLSSYIPIGGLNLRLSGEAGHARALSGTVVPLEDRFRLGGTGSLRGFQRQSVGPRNQAQRVQVDWPDGIGPVLDRTERDDRTRWIPTGGDTTAVAIAELVLPLPALGLAGWDGYAAALFADVGNVWLVGPGKATSSGLPEAPMVRYGVGVGARVATPVGPLQLDLAANPATVLSSPETQALLDAWEEPTFRFHLSLGTLW
jgi:outer membrane protein assembly complex protein YaeT